MSEYETRQFWEDKKSITIGFLVDSELDEIIKISNEIFKNR